MSGRRPWEFFLLTGMAREDRLATLQADQQKAMTMMFMGAFREWG